MKTIADEILEVLKDGAEENQEQEEEPVAQHDPQLVTPFDIIKQGVEALGKAIEGYEPTLDNLFDAIYKIGDPNIRNDLNAGITRMKSQLAILLEIVNHINDRANGKSKGEQGVG